ncbi:activator of HSP90 ATPase [Pilimelia anulata]|uniref:Activator of HSP90 ATPase n=1 Tax=Pilimelia anulata TaxID=53371 RepID=A0A8J3F8Y1_9ACTN|nr:SRPBCC family protein [Pilimelia anulata]GGJ82069.1 activator of HSP90 ATPase [Pilimelia anulata]
MSGKTEIIAAADQPTIEIRREFAAPRDLVYRAHVDPELLPQWLGPGRLTLRIDRLEVRDGGRWRYAHVEQDGTEYGFRGVFHGEPSVDGIVQTWEYEGAPGAVSLEFATFTEADGRTQLRTVSVYRTVAERDAMIASGMESGVEEGYTRLTELLGRQTATAR